mmetsp:Transcript_25366/g.59397  ORF Transcript_25366/g.59397 Transcript_25366/m.59397 type:complete len:672 (+) Transcript_25366:580-2595(+)|eukprot:CAMPEP_0197184668 /NCGR_PEP_ID=MMETSP1423-20130617/10294_1 /TAXON_ID=476441 /ORGANISM="Pseudo-nitzschia heimii, Strain UNC1101" /LENGTH=671 /DNA_ID=CAMNT_0042635541 /DNA_START=467 /DNA_END=2482 /DNA_ORIENTATION=+
MTAVPHKQMQPPASPLNMKQQLEATANRFWTSVTTNKKDKDDGIVDGGAIKGPSFPDAVYESQSSSDRSKAQCIQHNPLHSIFTSMFASCTTGANSYEMDSDDGAKPLPSLLEHASHSKVVLSKTITPTSSRSSSRLSTRGETPATQAVTPLPLQEQRPASAVKTALKESSKNMFKNDHDMAQEAIHRLRQQYKRDLAEKIVNESLNGSELAGDTDIDRSVLSRNPSLFSGNPSTLSGGPSTLSNNRTLSTVNHGTISSSMHMRAGTVSSSMHNRTGTVSSSMHNRTGTVSSGMHTRTGSSSTIHEHVTTIHEQVKQQQQSKKSSLQKFISPRLNKKNVKTSSKTPFEKASAPARKGHSFFPASTPKDRPAKSQKDPRKKKLRRSNGVPKEVRPTSPVRTLKNRNNQRQKEILNGSNDDDKFFVDFDNDGKDNENRDANESWDMGNDGISDITQSTVDKMVLAISQHLRVFPEEAENLNRIHSDVTDPAPKRGAIINDKDVTAASEFFPMVGGDVAGFTITPERRRVAKGMSPPKFTRNIGSTGTESFFTKTTQSTQTNDFANAWRIDEQKFWDGEVEKQAKKDGFEIRTHGQPNALKSPSRMMVIKKSRRSGGTSTYTSSTTATSPTTAFSSPKSWNARCRKQDGFVSREFLLNDDDQQMLQNALQTAEI